VLDYVRLMKPRVIWLLIMSSLVGYIVATEGEVDVVKLVQLALVGFLATGGSATLNMYFERDIDAIMERTSKRPLVVGRVPPAHALVQGLIMVSASVFLAALWLGVMPTLMVVLGAVVYVVVYTLVVKRRSWTSVLIGGVAANATFLTGWTMAKPVDLSALALSTAVYLWIPAHIWSLVIRYREDYVRARVPMLPVVVDYRFSVRLVSLVNILWVIYMALVAYYFLNTLAFMLMMPVAVVGTYVSVKTMSNPTADNFWVMFKTTSPLLTLFFLAIIISLAVS